MVIKHMQKTKIVIALVAVAVLGLVLVGLASAQIGVNQYSATNPTAAPNSGFWGWMGNCFGYSNNQQYANQYPTQQAPTDQTAPAPNQPYQNGYGYGYGYGPCWAR